MLIKVELNGPPFNNTRAVPPRRILGNAIISRVVPDSVGDCERSHSKTPVESNGSSQHKQPEPTSRIITRPRRISISKDCKLLQTGPGRLIALRNRPLKQQDKELPPKAKLSDGGSTKPKTNRSRLFEGESFIGKEERKYIEKLSDVAVPRLCSRLCGVNTAHFHYCSTLLRRRSYTSSSDESLSSAEECCYDLESTGDCINLKRSKNQSCSAAQRKKAKSDGPPPNDCEIERGRRHKQRDEITALKSLLPPDRRYISKVDILNTACEYIAELQSEAESLQEELRSEGVKNRRLKQRVTRQQRAEDPPLSEYIMKNCGSLDSVSGLLSSSFSVS